MPSQELIQAMNRYNQELMKAGALIDLAGLHPSSMGKRIRFSDEKRMIIDGPFAETKELIAGYWIIRASSLDEALEWAVQVPAPKGECTDGEIEIRQVFDVEDFAHCEAVTRTIEFREELAQSKK